MGLGNSALNTIVHPDLHAALNRFYPRVATISPTGEAMLYATGETAVGDCMAIADRVNVAIAGANAGDGVDVWLLVE